jgi:signal peptidase I
MRRQYGESNIGKVVGWSLVAVVVLAIWWFVFPPQLGGRTILLTTHGTSMEPLLHDGDLAILRKHDHYKVGEVVEYHSGALNAPLLHRITSYDPASRTYTTQGDNNNFVDLDHPTDKQINGEMIKRYKGWGKKTWIFKSVPIRIGGAVLVGLAVYFALTRTNENRDKGGKFRRVSTRLLKRRNASAGSSQAASASTTNAPLTPDPGSPLKPDLDSNRWSISQLRALIFSGQPVLFVAIALSLVSLVAAIVGYSYPTQTKGGGLVVYTVQGSLNYSAAATGGDLVYSNGQVQTGDTIYLSMVHDVFFTFDGSLVTAAHFSSGEGETIELDAVVKGSTGWSHTIVLTPAEPFSGDDAHITADVDLDQLKSTVQAITSLTKTNDGTSYTIVIQPVIHYIGSLDGQKLDTNFQPSATFVSTGGMLKPPGSVSTPTAQKPNAINADSGNHLTGLKTSSSGQLQIPSGIPQTLRAFGKYIGVVTLRTVGITGLIAGLGLIIALYVGRYLQRRRAMESEPLGALTRNSDMFVSVAGWGQVGNGAMIIDLPTLDDLVRVAETHGCLVLHEQNQAGNDVFVVNHRHLTYRYQESPSAHSERRFAASTQQEQFNSEVNHASE